MRRARPGVGSPPVYPLVFTVAWALQVFSDSGEPLEYLWRPFAVVVGAGAAGVLVSWLTGRARIAALVFSLAWFFFVRAWIVLAVLVALLAWRGFVDWQRRRQGRASMPEPAVGHVTRLADYFSLLLLVVTLVGLVLTFPLTFRSAPAAGAPAAGAPSIYLLMLDGYPRADTLAGLGIDNTGFLRELEGRGLSVSDMSRTNYNTTVLSLAALLRGDYLPEDDAQPPPLAFSESWELRRMSDKIAAGRMLTVLRERGYLVVATPTAFGAGALLSADRLLDQPHLTQLEYRYIHQSWMEALLDWLAPTWIVDSYAASVDTAFDQTQAFAATDHDRPAFVFMHALSPHPPFLFDAGGHRPDTSICADPGCGFGPRLAEMDISLDEYVPRMAGQIAYVNARVLQAVDDIEAADPDAVIIVFSDHGARFEAVTDDEYYHSLFAARTPGHANLYPDGMSLTNTLPVLFNAYFGTEYLIRDYRAWEYLDDLVHPLPRASVAP